jgi:hypothetical protein
VTYLKEKFDQRWHRDDVKENASEAEEREALQIWQHGVCSPVCVIHPPINHLQIHSPGSMEHVREYVIVSVSILIFILTCSVHCTQIIVYSSYPNHTNCQELRSKGYTLAHPSLRPTRLTCQVLFKSHCNVIDMNHLAALLLC